MFVSRVRAKRKHTKRLLAKMYYSPQSKVSTLYNVILRIARNLLETSKNVNEHRFYSDLSTKSTNQLTLYNIILRIARNLLETRENI